MKAKFIIYFPALCLFLFLCGCGAKKNTAFRRNYHALTTTYNVYFNANEAFKRGNKNIEESYSPDYSHIISMYAVSDKSTAGVATGDMARTVEKCESAIKEHSIRQKPLKDPKKTRDAQYMAFYNKEEFNPKMHKVWMLMGKAKFHANDYLAASAIFTYVTNHFSENKPLVAEANIWKARSFKEMGWLYEADDLMKRVSDDRFTSKQNLLYAGAYADLLIRQGELKAALPYLETAISLEKNRKIRARFLFIAGQIYQQLGEKEKAYKMYSKVISAHPSYQMAFNAMIRQTEVYTKGSNYMEMIRTLEKMAQSSKNKDYLDQVYYAIGNIYLTRNDTTKAIENYVLATEKSTRDGLEKAQVCIRLGDLYYARNEYLKAQPAYSEASSIISNDHPDYLRVSKLSQILDELATNNETVILQDSLQRLAKLPKEERMAIINKVIQQIIQEEIEEQKRRQKEWEESQRLGLEIENMAIMDQRALGNAQKVNWYFDNKSTVEKGKVEFQRKFGRRKLEDNWNRKNKVIISFSDETLADENMENDSTKENPEGEKLSEAATNPKNPEFYLRQMPFTDEQVAISNGQIADALFEMGIIYNEKLDDYIKSIETFEEFMLRFPKDPRVADACFYCYRILTKQQKKSEADVYRNRLIAKFPENNYAKILSEPDYQQKLERMYMEQDSIYEQTYKDFLAGNYYAVKRNTAFMEKTYSVSPLIPKFLLLNSLTSGKMGNRNELFKSLTDLVERYPNSDVVSMAKDILALMGQGKTPEAGSAGGLMALRMDNIPDGMMTEAELREAQFSTDETVPHLFLLITNPKQVDGNKLLYEIATYNFTKFLVKDFDIKTRAGELVVTGFDNLEEALWYVNGVLDERGIQRLLRDDNPKYLIISEDNYKLLLKGLSIADYEAFYQDNIANRKKKKARLKIELVGDEKALEELTSSQKPATEVKEGDNLNANKPAEKTSPDNAQQTPTEKQTPTDTTSAKNDGKTQPPDKNLRKYKGLYTYDADAPHYYAIILPKAGGGDFNTIKAALDKYNATSQTLLNLKVTQESGKDIPRIVTVGTLPDAKIAQSYLMQVIKDTGLKAALGNIEYRNIVISQDNLKTLQESGALAIYMELFKYFYMK